MDPALTEDIRRPRDLLRRYGIRPKKGLGQHFLVDAAYLAQIVDAAGIEPADDVLEVGPGLGVLTEVLAQKAKRVVAVELDPEMRTILEDRFQGTANVHIVEADILAVEPGDLLEYPPAVTGRRSCYKVVANLPYYITSAVLRHLLEARVQPETAVVMVQYEVAERILAEPGDLSILAIAVQFYAVPSRVATVPAGAFYPPPKVDSAVLRLDVRAQPAVAVEAGAFFRVVRAGFGQKRKQLKNSLAAGLGLEASEATRVLERAGLDPRRRAQSLTLAEWAALVGSLNEPGL